MGVPYWVPDAVFYQIFPDRFCNGDRGNDPANVVPWGSEPTPWNFMGGDLQGIINRLDYLLDLGINALYINPIFQSTSNHRYNTTDYFQIDPKLGTLADFQALIDAAHRNGVRLVIDGVFNHCGRGFFAFSDLLENQKYSPYRDWFYVNKFPVNAYQTEDDDSYVTWWGIKSLPKLNTKNQLVRKYLFDVARFWIEQGADGWRLDVPNEIDDDEFWEEFRHNVKTVNQDAYLLGEIWNGDPRWVGEGHFDGLMQYTVRDCLLRFIHADTLQASDCAQKMEDYISLYPEQNSYAMYLPLGSHDTERIFSKLDGMVDKIKFAYLFLFAYPGAPALYYGDEIGLSGGKDPECRKSFPLDERQWDHDLRNFLQKLIFIRKNHPVLRRGDFRTLYTDDSRRCYAFSRTLGEVTIVVGLNAGKARRSIQLPVAGLGWADRQRIYNMIEMGEYWVSGEKLTISLPVFSGIWITNEQIR